LGLLLSLGLILGTRNSLDADPAVSIRKFEEWGWRIPFLLSILLVGVSVYIRMRMKESPLFTELKASGKTSKNPLRESFVRRSNLKMVLLALFGMVMGQGVVWYTGQFYAQTYLENVMKVDFAQTRTILIWAIVFATPFFIFFGHLSDRIGRKWIMLAGMLLAIATYRPIYRQMSALTDTSGMVADAARTRIDRTMLPAASSDEPLVHVTTRSTLDNGVSLKEVRTDTLHRDGRDTGKGTVKSSKEVPHSVYWRLVALVFVQILYVTMVYGPIAAFLVELFPTRIRYTSMSLPYHIGNGVFGGLTPFIALLLTTIFKQDPLVGLWYPIGVAGVCLVIGALYVRNGIDPDVND
jgi:MFS family permease